MWTWLSFVPVIRAEIWQGCLYVGMWMAPQMPPLSILRPSRWHTTCLRVRSSALTLGQLATRSVAWETQANAMLAQIVRWQADGTVLCHLLPPPWKASWTFGVPPQLSGAVAVISGFFRQAVLVADPDAEVIEENAFHIFRN